jgi:septal ring factor EnvC (AmiA/AmiB activator)
MKMKYAANCITLVAVAALLSVGGCAAFDSKTPAAPETPPPQIKSEKFVEPNTKETTAVESAIIWSDKYTKLSEQMEQVQKKNLDLTQENQTLTNQVTKIQTQLDQAQKELTEANTLLVDMQKEFTNWKSDVLGFRDEMRKAQKAQIDALTHIITLLGGETTPPPAADANTAKHAESKTNEPNKNK